MEEKSDESLLNVDKYRNLFKNRRIQSNRTSETSSEQNVELETRSSFQKNYSYRILLIVNILERFAYYGLLCNFVLYFTKKPLYWESFNATTTIFIFLGTSHLSSVIGGWIADSFLGRYATIFLSLILYMIGYAIFPIISKSNNQVSEICLFNDNRSFVNMYPLIVTNYTIAGSDEFKRGLFEEPCSWLIFLSVIVVGIAVGFAKTNLGAYGADQLLGQGPQKVFAYFNWLYWCINLGSLMSLSGLAYIQQNYSFFIGYIIPFCALALAFILFSTGKVCYIKKSEKDASVLTNVVKVVANAIKTWRQTVQIIERKKSYRDLATSIEDSQSLNESVDVELDRDISRRKKISLLDYAKIRYGGKFEDNLVDDVKSLRKIVALFALFLPYWIVYFQIETTFLVQGLHMKLYETETSNLKSNFRIPAAWLSIADQVIIILLIPILDKCVYPFLKNRMQYELKARTRMIIGMLFAALSVSAAGLVETTRLAIIMNNSSSTSSLIPQIIDNTTYLAANFSILWQIPQYTLVGISEVFCSIAGLYFAYTAAPKSMQSIIIGIFYLFMGIGSFLGSLIVYIFRGLIYSKKIADDINCETCHLDCYFYFLAFLQVLGIVVFVAIDSKYSITVSNKEILEKTKENLTATAKVKNYFTFNRASTDEGTLTSLASSVNEASLKKDSLNNLVKNNSNSNLIRSVNN